MHFANSVIYRPPKVHSGGSRGGRYATGVMARVLVMLRVGSVGQNCEKNKSSVIYYSSGHVRRIGILGVVVKRLKVYVFGREMV